MHGVPWTLSALRQVDGLLQIGFRRYQVTRIGQRARQIRERHGDMSVVERAFLTTYRDCLFEQGDRPLAQALTTIGEADAFEQLSTHFRLQA